MKNIMKWTLTGLTLVTSMQSMAAQEGYGVPGPGTKELRPGAPISHDFKCSVPVKNGQQLEGVGYALRIDTAALPPEFNVTGASLLSRAVTPNPIIQTENLEQKYQNAYIVVYAGEYATVVLKKSDFAAQIVFAGGATSDCTMIK